MPFTDYVSDLTSHRARFRTPPFLPGNQLPADSTTAPAPGEQPDLTDASTQTGGPDLGTPYTGWGEPVTDAYNRPGGWATRRSPNPQPRQRANPAAPTVFADPERDTVEAPSAGGPAVSTPPYPTWAPRSAETAARQAAQRRTQTVAGPGIGEGPVAHGADGPLTGDPSAQTGEPDVNRPYPDWTKRASDDSERQRQLLNNPPAPAQGARGKIGSVVNALAAFTQWPGLRYIGGKLQYPGGDQYQADVARGQQQLDLDAQQAQTQATIENQRSQRQEAQQRMAVQDMNNRRNVYTRQQNELDKDQAFGVPDIPASVTSSTIPEDPNQPLSPTNIPTTQRTLTPGIPAENQWASPVPGAPAQRVPQLGSVRRITDPDSGQTSTMVVPNPATRQQITQASWPTVTQEMVDALPKANLRVGDPMRPDDWKDYQRRLQAKDTQANRPDKFINVAPGGTVFDTNTSKAVFTAQPKSAAATPAQFAAIERQKGVALQKAYAAAQKELKPFLGASGTFAAQKRNAINADLIDQYQEIQNSYEAQIGELTGNPVEHFEYPRPGAAAAPQAAAQPLPPAPAPTRSSAPTQPGARQPSASPGTFSEAEVRQTAVRRGQDPDAAVAFMKGRGYRLTQ